MSPRITIAYDGSSGATGAIRACAQLFPGADATVVTVPAPPPVSTAAPQRWVPTLSPEVVARTFDEIAAEGADAARQIAEGGAAEATRGGLAAQARVAPARAPAWMGLREAALESDVLACGTRGRGGVSRAVLGSTSTALLHNASTPLLVVPDGVGALDGPTLIAFDGSHAAAQAIALTARLLPGRAAVVVHVWESPYRHTLTGRALARTPQRDLQEVVAAVDDELASSANDITERGLAIARDAGLEHLRGETVDAGTSPWRALAATAGRLDAAVIVVGARGLGRAESALLGSVSSRLTHNAELPVLVVPAG